MKALVIGLVFAAIILAAGYLTPRFMPVSPDPATRDAQASAELARREIHAYDASLPLLAEEADLDQLKEAEFDRLVEGSSDEFAALGKKFSDEVRRVRSLDDRSAMSAGNLRALSTGAAGVKSSVATFEQRLRDNDKLLKAADKIRASGAAGRKVPVVGQIAGTVSSVEAEKLLTEARGVRSKLVDELGKLFSAAAAYNEAKSERDYNVGREVSNIKGELDGDIDEIAAAATDARAEVTVLKQTVASLESELSGVRSELDQLRAQRISLEKTGYTVGDDSSFNAYREQYLATGRRMALLQQREQQIRFGAAADGSDEPVLGLEELHRRLALAEQRSQGYAGAREALTQRREFVDRIGGDAATRAEAFGKRLSELESDVEVARERVLELNQQASELEDRASKAARRAATAYASAKSAVDAWKREAKALQSSKDPQRLNDRLKMIVGDDVAPAGAANSEAQAKMLIGRIATERALGIADIADTLARAGKLMASEPFVVPELEEQYDAARDEAIKTLGEARELYERLAQKNTNTSWVHQASLAMVYHLLSEIDQAGAAQHRSNMIAELGKAVANRTQSPHLRREVELYELLTGESEPTRSAPPTDEGASDAPPEDKSAGEGG